MEKFTQLDVWQKSHKLVLDIYKTAKEFPDEERFRLTDQLCRSASSVPANIAEGTGRNTLREYIQFLYNARGSLEETKYHLLLAGDLDYISEEDFNELTDSCNTVGKMLNGLISSLKARKNND